MSTARDNGAMSALLQRLVELEGSDLHLVPNYPPVFRVHGALRSEEDAILTGAQVSEFLESVIPAHIWTRMEGAKHVDCSIALPGASGPLRFRVNVFRARGQLGACFRHVADVIPSFEWMGIDQSLAEYLLKLRSGLVIVTGVTGSGKTTTLAGIVDSLVKQGDRRVITVEEPIEYEFQPVGASVVTQREVGADVDSFYDGLVSGLRQNPDVILVGEIRDRETARMATSAAETGILVLATLHSQDAKGAVTRLVDLFPQDLQADLRSQLSLSLRCVVCQHLLPSAQPGMKRSLALEVLTVNHAVASAIRSGKFESMESSIQTGKKDGMITLDESLIHLAAKGRITWETASQYSKDPEAMVRYKSPSRSL